MVGVSENINFTAEVDMYHGNWYWIVLVPCLISS